MKKVLLPLLAIVVLAMAACSGGSGDPKAVAKNFFEAFKSMDIDEAAKHATKDSKSMLDMMKMGMSFAPVNKDSLKQEMAKQKIEYGDAVINGDEATVSVSVDGKDKTDFKLKKEEGAWKVAFDKNTLMSMGKDKMKQQGASTEEMEEAQKALDGLNSDTVRNALEEAGKAIDSLSKQ